MVQTISACRSSTTGLEIRFIVMSFFVCGFLDRSTECMVFNASGLVEGKRFSVVERRG